MTPVKAAEEHWWQKWSDPKPTPPPMTPSRSTVRAPIVLIALMLALAPRAGAQGLPDYEKPPVSYSATPPADAVAALQRRLDAKIGRAHV